MAWLKTSSAKFVVIEFETRNPTIFRANFINGFRIHYDRARYYLILPGLVADAVNAIFGLDALVRKGNNWKKPPREWKMDWKIILGPS